MAYVFQQRCCSSCHRADVQISVEISCKSHHKMLRGAHQWDLQPAAGLKQADQSGSVPYSPSVHLQSLLTGQFESQMCWMKEESRTHVLCSTCGIGLRAGASLRGPVEAISALIARRWVYSIPLRSRTLSANTWPRQPHPANTHAGVRLPAPFSGHVRHI